jgi:hypothetical protein
MDHPLLSQDAGDPRRHGRAHLEAESGVGVDVWGVDPDVVRAHRHGFPPPAAPVTVTTTSPSALQGAPRVG